MKTLVYFILGLVLTTLNLNAQTATQDGFDITVTIPNIGNNDGNVKIALHTENSFMKSDGLQNASSKIEDGTVTVVFKNVSKGNYGILAFHDENNNGRMDFETNGMPKEAYGSSNNIMTYGPPNWTDSKFEVNKDTAITIRF